MNTDSIILPLVSVCIPTYNAAQTITDTLHGVVNQTYNNLEIIICDNQSTDNTVELVRQFQDSRIQLSINSENFGMVGNFNIVLSKAKGLYVKLLCADDIITHDCIEAEMDVFLQKANKNIVMVAAEKYVINEEGKRLFVKHFPGKEGIYNGEKVICKSFRHGTNIFGEPGSILFLTQAVQKTGNIELPKNLTYIVDLQLYINVLKQGDLYVLKKPLFSFRVSNHSYTASSKWEPAKVFYRFRKKLSKENSIQFSMYDKMAAFIMSWILCIARNLIFTITNKK